MRIDHLALANFKNFAQLSVDFQLGVNLFVGGNGSGKTSLLEGINVAVGGFFKSRLPKYQHPLKTREVRLVNGIRSSFTIVKAWSDLNQPGIYDPEVETEKRRWTIHKITGGKQTNFGSEYIEYIKAYGAKIFSHIEDIEDRTLAPLIAYYSTQRLFNDAKQFKEQKYDAPNGRRNGYLQCLDEHAIKPVLNEWLGNAVTRRATKQINDIAGTDLVLENVEEAIKYTVKDLLHLSAIKIYQDPDLNFEVFLQVENENPLPLSYYSDGFRNILYLVIDMVWRASQLNPWLTLAEISAQVTGVVTIDEIDLHLHPKWQAKAFGLIQQFFPQVQFFITTHSPTVVANFEHGTLYIIDENNVTPVAAKYFGKEVDSVLRNILGANDRHVPTQQKINLLLNKIDNEAPDEEIDMLLNDLTELLGQEDADLQRAISLYEWNKVKNQDADAVH